MRIHSFLDLYSHGVILSQNSVGIKEIKEKERDKERQALNQ